jgi:Na+/H+-dicarboxylate symporter
VINVFLFCRHHSALMQAPTREIVQPAMALAKTLTASFRLKQLVPILKYFVSIYLIYLLDIIYYYLIVFDLIIWYYLFDC